jgi:hypothetical protein
MFRRLSPVTEPDRESSGRPNAAPLSQILQETSPQSHAVPLSRILASQSPLGYAPVDASGGLHAAPLSQILASPSPLLDRPPASPSFWLHHPPASPSSLQHRPPASLSPLLHRLPPSPSPLPHHLPASPSFLLHHPPAPPSPLLQPRRSTTLAPVRQNSRRSRTPPRPAQIPKRGPKRKAAPFPPAVLWTPLVLPWPPGRSFPSGDALDSSTCPSLVLRRLPCPCQPLSCPPRSLSEHSQALQFAYAPVFRLWSRIFYRMAFSAFLTLSACCRWFSRSRCMVEYHRMFRKK